MRSTTCRPILPRLPAPLVNGALSEFAAFRTFSLAQGRWRLALFSTGPIPVTWDEPVDEKGLKEASSGRHNKAPAEVALKEFFKRVEVVTQIVHILKSMPWGEELQMTLKQLPVVFDTELVTQLLRVEIPSDVVLNLFHWLKELHGFKHTDHTVGIMLNTLGRSGRIKDMRELFLELKYDGWEFSAVTLSNLMIWLLNANDMQGVADMWQEICKSSKKKLPAVCTAYIDYLIRVKKYKRVQSLYESMLKERMLPRSRLHMVFIQHLVAAGKVEAAAKILKIMLKMHVVPNRATYEIVINGFAKAGNVVAVLEHLNEMREYFRRPTKNLLPTLHTLTAIGKLEEANNLIEDIWSGSESSLVQDNFEDDGNSGAEGDDLLSDWRYVARLHVGFDIIAFAQALTSWSSSVESILEQAHVDWTNALVLATMKHLKSLKVLWHFFNWLKDGQKFKHDAFACGFLTHKTLKSRLTLEKKAILVEKLFATMMDDGLELTVPLFNMVISHYVQLGETNKALDVFISLKKLGLKPNKYSYAHLIHGFSHNREHRKAVKVMKAMQKGGFEMDSVTRAQMITCLGLARKTEMAHGLFQEVLESEGYADAHVYKAIIRNYLRLGDLNMAVKLYEEMRENGIRVDQGMYYVVSAVLRRAQRHAELNEIVTVRNNLNFLHGKRKRLQESTIEVLQVFLENMIDIEASVSAESEEDGEIEEVSFFLETEDIYDQLEKKRDTQEASVEMEKKETEDVCVELEKRREREEAFV